MIIAFYCLFSPPNLGTSKESTNGIFCTHSSYQYNITNDNTIYGCIISHFYCTNVRDKVSVQLLLYADVKTELIKYKLGKTRYRRHKMSFAATRSCRVLEVGHVRETSALERCRSAEKNPTNMKL